MSEDEQFPFLTDKQTKEVLARAAPPAKAQSTTSAAAEPQDFCRGLDDSEFLNIDIDDFKNTQATEKVNKQHHESPDNIDGEDESLWRHWKRNKNAGNSPAKKNTKREASTGVAAN